MKLIGYGEIPDNCIVVFTGKYCVACRQLEKRFATEADESLQKLVKYVQVEDYPHTAAMYGIMSLPTMLFVRNGIIKSNIVGNVPLSTIRNELK